ncbi:MAG: hypothetical protein Phog2KO_37190 [Phototrophicaceae bacterium]
METVKQKIGLIKIFMFLGLSLDKVWSDLKTLKNLFWEGHRPLPYIIDVILDVGEGLKPSLKLYIYQSNCSLSESPSFKT